MRISVIIPTWCERDGIEEAIRAARAVGDEVVVADGGSPDGTAALAARAGARVVFAPKGRGAQLERGARCATGDVLLFLHADARLPPAARDAIRRALETPAVEGGNFRLRFAPDGVWARLFTWGDDVRRRVFRIYYGDSAIFVRRACHRRLGGFRPLPVMEDYEFVRRLERSCRTVYVRDVVVTASARRFARAPVRTLLVWIAVQSLYSLGVPSDRLARLYRDHRPG